MGRGFKECTDGPLLLHLAVGRPDVIKLLIATNPAALKVCSKGSVLQGCPLACVKLLMYDGVSGLCYKAGNSRNSFGSNDMEVLSYLLLPVSPRGLS